jgi:hypothetical protein
MIETGSEDHWQFWEMFCQSSCREVLCFSKEYCESLRHESVNSEGSPYEWTGTPKIYSKIGPLFAIGGLEKEVSHSIKIASRLAVTTLSGWFYWSCNQKRDVVPIRVSRSCHVCQNPDCGHALRPHWNRHLESYDDNFFTGMQWLVLNALPEGCKFNHEYFLEQVLPLFSQQKRLNPQENTVVDFAVQMDNSTSEGIMKAVTPIWNAVTFEELQSLFCGWIQWVAWVTEHRGNITTNKGYTF